MEVIKPGNVYGGVNECFAGAWLDSHMEAKAVLLAPIDKMVLTDGFLS